MDEMPEVTQVRRMMKRSVEILAGLEWEYVQVEKEIKEMKRRRDWSRAQPATTTGK